jgi:hypothetical protein
MTDNNKPSDQTPMKWVQTKETPEYYINAIHTTWTNSDVRFRVGRIIPQGQEIPFTFVIQEEAAITIAWAQMKNLRDILNHLIETYEKTNGELKSPALPQALPTPSTQS